jgi:hypothetical protein
LLSIVRAHGRAETFKQGGTNADVVERVEVERAELGSPFQIRHDVLGLGFRWILGKAEKVCGPACARIGGRSISSSL